MKCVQEWLQFYFEEVIMGPLEKGWRKWDIWGMKGAKHVLRRGGAAPFGGAGDHSRQGTWWASETARPGQLRNGGN